MSHIQGAQSFSGITTAFSLGSSSSLETAIAAFDPLSTNYHGGGLQEMTQAALNVMVQQGVQEAKDSGKSKEASALQSMAQKIG